jgi:hypothetical protein
MALEQRPDIEALALAIALSPIVVARRRVQKCAKDLSRKELPRDFPAGFEDADLAILRWIAGEGRRVGRAPRI